MKNLKKQKENKNQNKEIKNCEIEIQKVSFFEKVIKERRHRRKILY